MPRPSLKATTEATVVTEVKLQPKARAMLMERMTEHDRLAKQVKDIKGTKKHPGRMKRIEDEVVNLFKKEKQGRALLDGTSLDGHGVKMVLGKTKVFDQMGFMKKHGLSQEDFDEFTEYKDNEPYVRFTHPGEDDE